MELDFTGVTDACLSLLKARVGKQNRDFLNQGKITPPSLSGEKPQGDWRERIWNDYGRPLVHLAKFSP